MIFLYRKKYIVESYTKTDALRIYDKTKPVEETHISETIFKIESINDYDYEKDIDVNLQIDWLDK